jgi:hypothetical protein
MTVRENKAAPEALMFISGVGPLVADRDIRVVTHDRTLSHRCKRVIMCGGIVKSHGTMLAYTAKFSKGKAA